jgi:hypothetical protein
MNRCDYLTWRATFLEEAMVWRRHRNPQNLQTEQLALVRIRRAYYHGAPL